MFSCLFRASETSQQQQGACRAEEMGRPSGSPNPWAATPKIGSSAWAEGRVLGSLQPRSVASLCRGPTIRRDSSYALWPRQPPPIYPPMGSQTCFHEELSSSGRLEGGKKVPIQHLPHTENVTAEGDATIDASGSCDALPASLR
ncbi:hypothetical protein Taro_007249 [Colocasia esculenta]|uniref:Uncharacterized protein n=1 Tax=Colocasia esculenta TaxID=4460 RepID=A0A843TUL4_COLES|nr:hypothetical protein [Colocasia esculenta]